MKLRQSIEDFKVEEVGKFDISKTPDSYKIYLLEKRGLESFSLLSYLSKNNKINISDFGIAGLKDKHAVTRQYFTIPSKYGIGTLEEKNFNIKFLGYINKKIEVGDLRGNKFQITVRDIKKGEIDGIKQKSKTIGSAGVPNYFDSQRFGSVINKEFIAKCLIKKDYERAVKLFITQYTRHESSKIKQEKRIISENWNNISRLEIKTGYLAKIVNKYKKTNNWIETYKKIPANLREMFVSAYQSYLWNECVKEILRMIVDKKKIYPIAYDMGSLLFYKNLSDEEMEKIPPTFKTISDKIMPSKFEKDIIDKVLLKEGVNLEDFDIKKTSGNFFSVYERNVLVKPVDFEMSPFLTDELNDRGKNNRFKVILSFTLTKGSYATIITRRIFNQ